MDKKTLHCDIGPDGGMCEECKKHPSMVILSHVKEFRHFDEPHTIPLGAVVECNINVDDGWGADDIHKEGDKEMSIGIIGKVRLYVVGHTRDCDGTPLYVIAGEPISFPEGEKIFSPRYCLYRTVVHQCHHGISEDSLKVVGQAQLKSLNEYFDWSD